MAHRLGFDRPSTRRFGSHVAMLTALAATEARAGNDDAILVGNRAAMMAGAVAPLVSDASATWYNPAGLAQVRQNHVDLSATVYSLRHYSFSGLFRSTAGDVDDATVTEFLTVPAEAAMTRPLAPGVTLGLGYFAPEASDLVLRDSLTTAREGSRSNWQIALASTRIQNTGAVGLGLKLSPRVRLGFALFGLYETERDAQTVVLLSTEGAAQSVLVVSSLSTRSWFGVEAGTGFQFVLDPKLVFSLTARSPRALLLRSQRTSSVSAVASDGEVEARITEPAANATGLDFIRAGRAGAGVAWAVREGSWLSFEADVQPGIYSRKLGIDRSVVVNARAGTYHRFSETFAAGAGLFTDRSSTPDSNETLVGSGDFYGGTLGFDLRDHYRLASANSKEGLTLSTTIALRYAYSRARFSGLLVDPASGPLGDTGGALRTHELSLYVGGGAAF